MMQEEFRPILEELEAGRSAVLHRTVDGVEYTRLFRPRERQAPCSCGMQRRA